MERDDLRAQGRWEESRYVVDKLKILISDHRMVRLDHPYGCWHILRDFISMVRLFWLETRKKKRKAKGAKGPACKEGKP